MDLNEVKSNLCYYDKRNPECTMNEQELQEYFEYIKRQNTRRKVPKGCMCENCFYGRTALAGYILLLINK